MSAPSYTLFLNPEGWRLGVCRAGAPSISDPIDGDDNALPAAMKSAGYAGEGVILAIPSASCLAAPITTAGLPAKDRRAAMTYRLEEKLPLPAEEVIADFIPTPTDSNTTFGVCARIADLSPAVERLEAAGVSVTAICPASFLTLQHLLTTAPNADAILWQSAGEEEIELFLLNAGRPRGWYVLPGGARDLLTHLSLELPPRAAQPWTIAALHLDSSVSAAIAKRDDIEIIPLDAESPALAAATASRAILTGDATPWIDLRRDALAPGDRLRQVRGSLTYAVAAVVLCLLSACGAMLWRAARYDALATRLADDQRSAYRAAFPDAPVPDDVLSRLASEERNLRGLSGDTAAAPLADANGLVTLRDLLTRLPPPNSLRYRVLELRLDQGRFTMEGQTAAHGDADAIATALRAGGAFDVEPPRTERLPAADAADGAVTFTLTGHSAASQRKGAR